MSQPIKDVAVYVVNLDKPTELRYLDITSSNDEYYISNVPMDNSKIVFTSKDYKTVTYTNSGDLVTFLLKKYPIDIFLELCNEMPYKPSRDIVEAVILEVYGKFTDELFYEWQNFLVGEVIQEDPYEDIDINSYIIEKINITGLEENEIKNNNYWIRTVSYRDKELKDYAAAGII